ncbi:MAG: type II secretion system protein [Rubrivivax sp.]|nr:MAG: type II secretion system protein [Rubrivivax sp.]
MKRVQAGFTMIELIVVIVILGILAATALPKFIDLSGAAKDSAIAGLAGSASSAMSINYAGCASKNHVVTPGLCVAVADCSDISTVLQGAPAGTVAAGYTVTAAAIAANNGTTATCTITSSSDATKTATFTAIRAGT